MKAGGHYHKQEVSNSKKIARGLPEVPSEIESYEPVASCKVVNQELKVQLHVEIQNPGFSLETGHYDSREDVLIPTFWVLSKLPPLPCLMTC